MDDNAEERLTDAAAAVAGATAGGLVGLAVGGPLGALVLAPVGAIVEHSGKAISAAYRAQRERNATRVLEQAANELGDDVELLKQRLLASPDLLNLAGQALEAGAATTLEDKIRALGRSLAAGASDDARVDSELLMMGALRDLEAPHVKLLAWFADGDTEGRGYEVRAREAMPELAPLLGQLVAVLVRHGLIAPIATDLTNMLKQAAQQSRKVNQPMERYIHNPLPGWQITEFGRELLRRLPTA